MIPWYYTTIFTTLFDVTELLYIDNAIFGELFGAEKITNFFV